MRESRRHSFAHTNKNAPAFYVPQDFDLNLMCEDQRQHAAFFLNLLHWKWICWQADENGYIRLKHRYITRIIPPSSWPEVRDRLWGRGVIQWSRVWDQGRRSQGYKIAPKYRKTRRITCSDESLALKINRVNGADNSKLPVHRWLSEKLTRIEFDEPLSRQIVPEMTPNHSSAIEIDEYRLLITETCQKFLNRDLPLTVDRFGRVHTPITSLPKELRVCLSVGHEKLVNIDLANSQPLFAGVVAAEFHRSKAVAQRLRHRRFGVGKHPYHNRKLRKRVGTIGRKDLTRYLEICQRGAIYEHLADDGKERETVKQQFLTAMCDKERKQPSATCKRIESEFPSVASMFKSLKKKNYRQAAHVMQNFESTFFIHVVCRRIMEEKPDLPLFTIHDSILTTAPQVEYVERVIYEEFGKLGVTPKLRRERNE